MFITYEEMSNQFLCLFYFFFINSHFIPNLSGLGIYITKLNRSILSNIDAFADNETGSWNSYSEMTLQTYFSHLYRLVVRDLHPPQLTEVVKKIKAEKGVTLACTDPMAPTV